MRQRIELHTSQIADYKVCPRLYRYRNVLGLKPKVESDKLIFGTGVHLALAAYYSAKPPVRDVLLGTYTEWTRAELARIRPLLPSDELGQEMADLFAMGARLLDVYADYAQASDDFQVLVAEQEFELPIRHPTTGRALPLVFHRGRLDGIVRDGYGRLWLLEHKTHKDFPNEALLSLDEQFGFYVLAARQLFPQYPVAGLLLNVIRKRDPATARDKSPENFVRRYRILKNNHEIERLRWRLYNAYKTIRADRSFEPSPGLHCSWRCPFSQLCTAEEDGTDVGALIDAFYEVREQDREVRED